MASGRQHHQATMVTGVLTTCLTTITFSPEIILGSVTSTVIAVFYNPDTDLPSDTHGENKLGKAPIIGKVLQMFLMMITMPYALFVGHRSQYSHLPILSDIIRYLYAETLVIYLGSLTFLYEFPTLAGAIIDAVNLGTGMSFIEWLTWISSPTFISYFITAIAQTSVHALALDGAMILKYDNKKRRNVRHYIFGKQWYNWCRNQFGNE